MLWTFGQVHILLPNNPEYKNEVNYNKFGKNERRNYWIIRNTATIILLLAFETRTGYVMFDQSSNFCFPIFLSKRMRTNWEIVDKWNYSILWNVSFTYSCLLWNQTWLYNVWRRVEWCYSCAISTTCVVPMEVVLLKR